tara:strand:- start:221 stop:727 length:507 start_codon:yes stop_codon:yes gene_type:complete
MIGYDARAIANVILDDADQLGVELTNLAIQKVLYFCHGWHLVQYQRPLIRQQFEAWKYGPVISSVYSEFKDSGEHAIGRHRASRLNPKLRMREIALDPIDPDHLTAISRVVSCYARVDALKLMQMTHVPYGPWAQIWHDREAANLRMIIPDEMIFRHFNNLDGSRIFN